MLLVDTNVLVDVLEDDPLWADWSVQQLRAQSQVHQLFINPVIYAELSLTFDSVKELDAAIEGIGLKVQEMPRPALFLAGRAFLKYRRGGGTSTNVLADLFIERHPIFGLEGTFGFDAWFGFVSCVVLIVLSKALGAFLKRSDRYYDGDRS